MTSKLQSVHLDKVTTSPALKLPHLFSLTPNSSGKGMQTPKRRSDQTETLPVGKSVDPHLANDRLVALEQDSDICYAQNIRRSVREAALSTPSVNPDWSEDKMSNDGSDHFFVPLSSSVPQKEVEAFPNRRKQRLVFSTHAIRTKDRLANSENHLNSTPNGHQTFSDFDESYDQVFSPPLLTDSSFFTDIYEDLLAPLSETDAALMEQ